MAENSIDAVFGGGPLGLAVVETLVQRGRAVQLVTRSARVDTPGGVQVVAGDVSDPERFAEAARGAATIYHCVGADYGKWQQLLPAVMAGVMHAAEATGARLIYGDNLYAYGPVEAPLTEALPSLASGPNGRLRAELAARLLDSSRWTPARDHRSGLGLLWAASAAVHGWRARRGARRGLARPER